MEIIDLSASPVPPIWNLVYARLIKFVPFIFEGFFKVSHGIKVAFYNLRFRMPQTLEGWHPFYRCDILHFAFIMTVLSAV